MGVLIERESDDQKYKDTYEDVQRIISISDEVKISVESTNEKPSKTKTPDMDDEQMLATSKLAKKKGVETKELQDKLEAAGYIEQTDSKVNITQKGKESGGLPKSSRFGDYILWPCELEL